MIDDVNQDQHDQAAIEIVDLDTPMSQD